MLVVAALLGLGLVNAYVFVWRDESALGDLGQRGRGGRAAGAHEMTRQVCPHSNPSGPARRAGRSYGPHAGEGAGPPPSRKWEKNLFWFFA